jgi:predicted phosphodiesterase
MRVAVVSDIHANLQALEAALAAIADDRADEIWCLGDLVGYGPRPNECCELVRERAAVCLVGNHDLVVLGDVALEEFNAEAAAAALWTREVLDRRSESFLRGLTAELRVGDVELFHGSPRDPVWDYVLDEAAVDASFELTTAPVVLVGHSHVPIAALARRGRVEAAHAPAGTEASLRGGRALLNPGSVGQPRDGDPRGAYLLVDRDARLAVFRRFEYPLERTQAEMRDAGLPAPLVERLAHGI